MPQPRLTLCTELPSAALVELFADGSVLGFLQRTRSCVTMAMLDLDPQRADLIRTLERAGVQVAAWMLVDLSEGYWLNADNAPAARSRYRQLRDWAEREELSLCRIGLDIEPPRDRAEALMVEPLAAALRALTERRDPATLARAEDAYRRLVEEIHRDGRAVDSYQYPLIADERRANSSLIRRAIGLVDVPVDREILMLYRSWMGPEGTRAYFADAEAVALGVTGGGVNAGRDDIEPTIDWNALREELLRAVKHVDDVSIFSLEGCVQQGMLERIETLDWDRPVQEPGAWPMQRARLHRHIVKWVARGEHILDRWLPARPAPSVTAPAPD